MGKINWIFENIDKNLKIIAKVVFFICVVVGAIFVVLGLIKVLALGGSDSKREMQEAYTYLYIGLGACVSSVTVLPLYAFGELVSLCREIRGNTKRIANEASDREEQ